MTQPLIDQLYFQAHGLDVTEPEALEEAVRLAVQRLPVGLYTESARSLTEDEIKLLRAGGLSPAAESGPDPLTETTVAFAALLQTSLTTAQAAERLGVHISRVRQLLAGPLYGFQLEGHWRIPRFQFGDRGLVANIDQVNAALNRSLHPVAIYRWYTTPDPDLETETGPVSPLAWLAAGYDPTAVRTLAADL